MTYDEFVGEVAAAYATNQLRYGQTYYNMLPAEIADVICATHLDPFYYEFVTPECHERVQRIWDRR